MRVDGFQERRVSFLKFVTPGRLTSCQQSVLHEYVVNKVVSVCYIKQRA